jgi:hypothetical protein
MPEHESAQLLAVIFGAHDFPKATLASTRAFSTSAMDFRDYLTDPHGLAVPERNIEWLFDDSRGPNDQLEDIAAFIQRRTQQLKNDGVTPQDLLVYYVGHGLFARGGQAYCFAVRSTNEKNEGASSIRGSDFANVLKDNALSLRRFLIIDCCFSAQLYKEFQSGPLQAAHIKLSEEMPSRGTSLLCSSNARDASLAPQGLGRTMFSDALLSVLRRGHPSLGPRFSFSELGDVVKEYIRSKYTDEWVRPEVQSPDQREGDIAHVPLFPNPAYGGALERERPAEKAQSAEERRGERGNAERQPAEAERERLRQESAEAKRAAQRVKGFGLVEQIARDRAERERVERENQAGRAAQRVKSFGLVEQIARDRAEQERGARENEAKRAAQRVKEDADEAKDDRSGRAPKS